MFIVGHILCNKIHRIKSTYLSWHFAFCTLLHYIWLFYLLLYILSFIRQSLKPTTSNVRFICHIPTHRCKWMVVRAALQTKSKPWYLLTLIGCPSQSVKQTKMQTVGPWVTVWRPTEVSSCHFKLWFFEPLGLILKECQIKFNKFHDHDSISLIHGHQPLPDHKSLVAEETL